MNQKLCRTPVSARGLARRRIVRFIRCFVPLIALSLFATHVAYGAVASFTPLGLFGGIRSAANDVSADGTVVIGTVYDASNIPTGLFRWSAARTVIGPAPASFPATPAISADGSVIVGQYDSPNGLEAFRWPFGGTYQGLGDFAGGPFDSRAIDVSADGSVIVGYGTPSSNRESFGWSQTNGLVLLRNPPGGSKSSTATGVSGNGTQIVGLSIPVSVFRWTNESGFVELPIAGDNHTRVSADGSVVVGTRGLPSPPGSIHPQMEAYRWSESEGVIGLGSLNDFRLASQALDVSADGSVVVGADAMGGIGPNRAFYWRRDIRMVDLRHLLMGQGVTGLDNWQLLEAWAVSADGNTIVGTGFHDGIGEAWMATVPEPSTLGLALLAIAGMTCYVRSKR
jgi:uncharacterized membrane protein